MCIDNNLGIDLFRIENELKNKCPLAVYVKTTKINNNLYIRVDALYKKDYPNNIDDNSMFMEFHVDLSLGKLEFFRGGHVWLSPYDAENDFKYYAMRGILSISNEYGVKKFRKCNVKNETDIINKISKSFNETMESIIYYTGGYPYKNGILTTKIK